ncbi:MAG: hypothetical protein LBC73_03305 [Oscillospiraceae bacterium]|jgi:hypothetical protein|nr:hypothetical protein [Oscillospiraceae bacterium]
MKKVIIVFFILLNVMLFLGIREVYLENDLTDMLQIHTVQPDIVHSALIISNANDDSIDNDVSDAMFEMFRYLSKRFDISIEYGEYYRNQSEYLRYLISYTPIDERLELITDTSLDFFNADNELFYTNRHGVDNGVNFYLLNNRITVNFFPITALGIIRGGEYMFVARSQAELDESISIFMSEFGSYVDRIAEFGADPFIVDEAINLFLLPTTVIMMMLIALLIIIFIHLNAKKIAIQKTMGLSVIHIVRKMLLPFIVIIVFTIGIVNIALFTVFVGTINARTIPIIVTLTNSAVLQLIGVIITIAISCLLLLLIPTYSLLKNNNFSRYLMGANYMLKILALLIMLPLLSGRIDLIQGNIKMINHVEYYENNAEILNFEFSPMFNPRYRGNGYGSLLMEIVMSASGGDITEEMVFEHELLYEYQRAYRILNEAGAIFSQNSSSFDEILILTINENYMAKHPIRNTDGSLVNTDQFESEITLLVPEIHINNDFIINMVVPHYSIIEIDNEQILYDYSLGWGFYGVPEQPYIIMAFTDAAFRFDASPFRSVFIDFDFNETLKNTPFYDRILISTVGNELNRIRAYHTREAAEHLLVMIPIYVLILLIIIQYSYFYNKAYQKRIFVQRIMGYNPFRIYLQMLFESSLIVLMIISIGWYLQLDVRLLLMVLVLEVIVYLTVVMISRKKSLVYNYE